MSRLASSNRHPSEGWGPYDRLAAAAFRGSPWMPAYAGMTGKGDVL
jgi:hypothetical protein